MSMSMHVIALREPDKRFEQHMEVFAACRAVGSDLPPQTAEYLGEDAISYDGAEDAREAALAVDISAILEGRSDVASADLVLDLGKLPRGVSKLIFRAAW